MNSLTGTGVDHSGPEESSRPAPTTIAALFADATQRIMQNGAFSILDQAIVSGANFLTTLIIARTCSQEELGLYALAWTVVLFLAAVQGNLITVPYTMYCHRRVGVASAEYAGSTLAHQLWTSLAAMACFLGLIVVLSFDIGPEHLRPAAWVLVGVIPFILLRDYARRFTFAHLAITVAVIVDGIVAALQLGTLLGLREFGWLSAATAYGSMGAACAVGCLCWRLLDHQPIRFTRAKFGEDWRMNWSFGRWALLSQLAGFAFYLLPWILASVWGEAETGVFAACGTLVGLSNLFVLGLNNFLMPKAAHAFTTRGASALRAVLRKAMLYALIVLGTMCVVVFFAGDFLAGLVYGAKYAHAGPLVAILAVATLTDALGLMASTGLWAMDRPAANILGDVVQLVTTLGLAIWLVFPWGAMGIATAMVVGRSAGATVRWATFRRLANALQPIANLA